MPVPNSTYKTLCLAFNKLTVHQAHDIFQLRAAVFVVEQDCVYQDIDGLDSVARHLLMYKNEQLVAYARLFNKGEQHKEYAVIGRVVVRQTYRSKGLGYQLIEKTITALSKEGKIPPIKISAQSHLKAFYENLGFVSTGNDYMEDGIPHSEMVR